MKNLLLIGFSLLLFSCRKDLNDPKELDEELTQSSWNLTSKISSNGQYGNTWNEVWNFHPDGTFELYSEVAAPYTSYSLWSMDSIKSNHVHIQYWGFNRDFLIKELSYKKCVLGNDLYSNGLETTYTLER